MPFQNRYCGPTRDTYAENYYQHNESWYCPRQFRLGLTWRFGKTSINFKQEDLKAAYTPTVGYWVKECSKDKLVLERFEVNTDGPNFSG